MMMMESHATKFPARSFVLMLMPDELWNCAVTEWDWDVIENDPFFPQMFHDCMATCSVTRELKD